MTTIETPRVVNLTQVAEILEMKVSNVAAFLERRGVVPFATTIQGRLWTLTSIEAVRDVYEAEGRREADVRRSVSMRNPGGRSGPVRRDRVVARTGPTQRRILVAFASGGLVDGAGSSSVRSAFRRLVERGLVEPVGSVGRARSFRLTREGRRVAGLIVEEDASP